MIEFQNRKEISISYKVTVEEQYLSNLQLYETKFSLYQYWY